MPTLRASGGTNTRRARLKTTRSPKRISPSSGRSRPATQRSVVDLPQPLGPSRVRIWPWGASSETPSAARTTCRPTR